MDEYLKDLILLFFENHKENYSIGLLMSTIGVDKSEVDELIDSLINEELLVYKDYLLSLTENGKIKIEKYIDLNIESKKLNIKEIEFNEVKRPPYIPRGFNKKV